MVTTRTEEQQDDHCWLTVNRAGWKIRGKTGDLVYLWRGYVPDEEYAVLDTGCVEMKKYCDAAAELLARREADARN